MYYYQRIRDIREDTDMTQKQVAQILEITTQQYQLYESGKREMPMHLFIKLADYYNVSLDYIMGREVVQELDNRTDIEKISAENNLTDSDQEFLKQNQEQLVQLLKEKQNEIDELKRENQELRAKYE